MLTIWLCTIFPYSGVTMDIALDHFTTASRHFTLLDAPGHRDFIPNMISGAAQADAALLVVDASTGEFESGFEGGGQTREHALLVRSLGVKQVVVVDKLDQVEWSVDRFDDIEDQMRPFLAQSGFSPAKTTFIPVGAMQGVNLVDDRGAKLIPWYTGPTLVDQLGMFRDRSSPEFRTDQR
jgi:elongation factor 1 alpha-like protein